MKSAFRPLVLSLLALAFVLAGPLRATTFMMMPDSALADQASAVLDVKVLTVDSAPVVDGPPSTDYLVEVNRVLKGDISGSTLVVRVPGGVNPAGLGLKVWGAPQFAPGENALLFLAPAKDGTYRILHLMLSTPHLSLRRMQCAFDLFLHPCDPPLSVLQHLLHPLLQLHPAVDQARHVHALLRKRSNRLAEWSAAAAAHVSQIVDNSFYILAVELMHAAQAVNLRQREDPNLGLGRGTRPFLEAYRKRVPFLDKDRVLSTDIQKSYEFLRTS